MYVNYHYIIKLIIGMTLNMANYFLPIMETMIGWIMVFYGETVNSIEHCLKIFSRTFWVNNIHRPSHGMKKIIVDFLLILWSISIQIKFMNIINNFFVSDATFSYRYIIHRHFSDIFHELVNRSEKLYKKNEWTKCNSL